MTKPRKTARPELELLATQVLAQQWITKKLQTEAFPLPAGISEEDFSRAMGALVQWTVSAYCAGAQEREQEIRDGRLPLADVMPR